MYYIGLDVGGTNIKAGLVDPEGTVLYRTKAPTLANRASEEIAESMCLLVRTVLEESGVPASAVESIGIGIPGVCSEEAGTVLYTPNINLSAFPLRAYIEKRFSLPVHLGNDANCAALGEYFCLTERPRDMILITLGTGIGGGLILGGRLHAGFNGIAGEVGHILLVPDGAPCECGRKGCWESYASVSALVRQTRAFVSAHPESPLAKGVGEDLSLICGKTPFDFAKAGDKDAQSLVDTWTGYVAEGLTDIVNIFQPELLLIGGAISAEGETLLAPLSRKVEDKMYKSCVPRPKIKAAAKGNDAGLIGAAFLGRK